MFKHVIDDETELRLLEPRHAGELFALVDENREHLRRWLPWVDATKTVEDSRRFLLRQLRAFAQALGVTVGIWHKGQLAGVIGLHVRPLSRRAEIGYWLGEAFQGKGLMTKACKALIDYAFTELKLHRVEIHCAVSNTRSRAIPERLGFQQEGVLREATWTSSGFDDLVVYGMLAHEWAAYRKRS